MNFHVLTIFPELFSSFLRTGIVRIALESRAAAVTLYDIRDFTEDRHRSVDDKPYGGGPGMLMKVEPVVRCVEDVVARNSLSSYRNVMLSPQGSVFCQEKAAELVEDENVILICGRYEGFDERIRKILKPEEVSIGDFVLSGGELPAMVLMESVIRLVPGVLGSNESLQNESFEGNRLEGPQYTRPETFRGYSVPEVLLSGNHQKIKAWRETAALKRTEQRRKDLLGVQL